jgi:hypothetical protein
MITNLQLPFIKKKMKKNVPLNFKVILLCYCLLCSWTGVQAQDLHWARNLNGTGYDAAKCAVVDAQGNTLVAGIFTETTDFDPGTPVQNMVSSGWDMFLLKLDTAGNFLWVKHFVPSNTDILSEPSDIAIDSLGNIYITGNFGSFGQTGTLDFDPSTGVQNLSPSGELYATDIFVLKLNNAGAFSWVKQFKGNKEHQSTAISIDHEGNVFTTGYFKDTVDFDPGTGTANLASSTTYGNVFISKLDNDGDFVWAKRLGGTEVIRAKSVKTDAAGNIYTMGIFAGTIDFDPNAGTQILTTSMGPYGWSNGNIFISKLDNDGNYIWAKNTGMPNNIYSGDVSPMSMAIDAWGNVITTGGFTDTADFDPGPDTANLVSTLTGTTDVNIFVSKLNNNGDFAWAKSMGGISSELGYGITTDAQGNVYTVGTFAGPADFDPSDTAELLMTSPSAAGALFISRLDTEGNFKWAKTIGGAQCGLGLNGIEIMINPVDNAVHIASEFTCTVDFDPGPDTFNLSAASNNVFVVKLKNCNLITSAMNVTACDSFNLNGMVYAQSGSFTQNFVTALGCDSLIKLELVINQKPGVTVTQTGNVLAANTGGAVYQWINCNDNSPVSGATAQSLTATVNGSYAVVISKNGCSDTSTCYNVSGLGLEDVASFNSIQVYPNPVTGTVTISIPEMTKNGTIRLINVLGQTVMQKTNVNGRKILLNMQHLASGTYILQFADGVKILRAKIIKE